MSLFQASCASLNLPLQTQRSLVPAWSRSSPQSPVPANLVAAAEAPYHYQGPSINSRADVPVPGRGRPVPVGECG